MIVSLLCCLEMIESSNNYQVHDGMNINSNQIDPSWIISSMRKENHIFCLAACNSNQECLSTIYIESETNNNCLLYRKNFAEAETTLSSNSKLFIKKSIRFNKYFNEF
jgi:hypothetical protein